MNNNTSERIKFYEYLVSLSQDELEQKHHIIESLLIELRREFLKFKKNITVTELENQLYDKLVAATESEVKNSANETFLVYTKTFLVMEMFMILLVSTILQKIAHNNLGHFEIYDTLRGGTGVCFHLSINNETRSLGFWSLAMVAEFDYQDYVDLLLTNDLNIITNKKFNTLAGIYDFQTLTQPWSCIFDDFTTLYTRLSTKVHL